MPKPIVYNDMTVNVDVWHGTIHVKLAGLDQTYSPEEFAQLVYPAVKASADALAAAPKQSTLPTA